ncbi:MAG: response regulator [Candidatus Omnitrophota bacterium]|jgi:CheY-like chemotaxis protein
MKKIVLVIDDEIDIREVLSARLKAQEYDVVTASNGQEGLAAIKTKIPDVILLDVMMPVMDGFEFFKLLKKDQKYMEIPTIVITSRRLMKDTFEALGVHEFISKPFDDQEIKSKIDFVLAKKALVLCKDSGAIDCIAKALQQSGYQACAVNSENDLLMKGKAFKCEIIVLHPAFLKQGPEEFLPRIGEMQYKNPLIIVYSDANLKGTEDGSTLAIEEAKTKWAKNKVNMFYDARLVSESFSKVLESWVTKK